MASPRLRPESNAPPRRLLSARVVVIAHCALIIALVAIAARLTWPSYVLGRGDVLYDATVAHHLLHDHSFSTNLLPLGGLRVLDGLHLAQADPWPSAHKFPAAQARLALFFLFFGESTRTAQLASVASYAAVALMLYGGVRRACGSGAFALLSVTVFLLHAYLRGIAVSGLTITSDAALIFLLAFLWQRGLEGKGGLFALGVCLGVLVLHRYSFILILPFIGFSLYRSRVRLQRHFIFGVATMLVPFWSFSLWHFRMLFPSYLSDSLVLHRTKYLPTDPWYTANWPSLASVLAKDPCVLLAKWVANLGAFIHGCTGSVGGWLQATVILGLCAYGLWIRRQERHGATDRYWLAFGACHLAAILFLSSTINYHLFALPLIWLVASEAVWFVVLRLRATRSSAVGALGGALLVLPFIAEQLASEARRLQYDRGLREGRFHLVDELPVRREVQRAIDRRADELDRDKLLVLGGTLPWDLAFGSRHRYLPIIPSPDELPAVESAVSMVDAVYLPVDFGFAGDGQPPPFWWMWQRLAMEPPDSFCGLRRHERFTDGSNLYVRASKVDCSDVCELETGLRAEWPDAAFSVPAIHGVESRGSVHWRWLEGQRATIPFVACKAHAWPFGLSGYFHETPILTIRVNGETVWSGEAHTPDDNPALVTFDVPPSVLRDGVNQLELSAERVNAQGVAMAFTSFGRAASHQE